MPTLTYIWLLAAVLLMVGEVLTGTFFLAAVAVGCAAAAGVAALGFGLEAQVTGMIGGALLTFFAARPLLSRLGYASSRHVRTNMEKLPGLSGSVLEPIGGGSAYGRVSVNGDDWRAQSATGEPIPAGEQVVVLEVHGATLSVIPEPNLRR